MTPPCTVGRWQSQRRQPARQTVYHQPASVLRRDCKDCKRAPLSAYDCILTRVSKPGSYLHSVCGLSELLGSAETSIGEEGCNDSPEQRLGNHERTLWRPDGNPRLVWTSHAVSTRSHAAALANATAFRHAPGEKRPGELLASTRQSCPVHGSPSKSFLR